MMNRSCRKAGLFSATVAAFLIESYKKLSPDSGDRNAFYLRQISQQLANSTFVPAETYFPHPPTTSIICVNTVWALSLVLSLTSALFATLIQQWVRRYIEFPHIPSSSSERARVRSYLFLGTLNFGMRHAVETAPTLLHLSMFLFLVGLVIFFFTVYKTIAIVLSTFVGLIGMAYFTLSILPCVYRNCPYSTPVSSILWCLWHAFVSLALFCLRWILRRFHALLVPYNLGDVKTRRQRKLTQWLGGTEDSLDKHTKFLKDGFRIGIIQGALDAPVAVELRALAWLLKQPAMAEKSKIQDFIANAPEDITVQLMSVPDESGRVIFRDHLLTLLRSCAPDTVGLNEDVRRRRLLVCLDAIFRIVKASGDPHGFLLSESVLRDMRTNFATIGLMRMLWADADPYVRVISRSICALIARHFIRKHPLEESELAWLQDVMGKSSYTIFNSLDNLAKADLMNLDSYVHGVLADQMVDLPVRSATFFMEMVAILGSAGSRGAFRRSILEGGISSLLQRAEEQDGVLREVVGKLHRVLETVFPSAVQEPRISNNLNRQGDVHGTIQLIRFPLSTPR